MDLLNNLPPNLLSIIRNKSKIVDKCLIWTGAISKSTGYGKIKYEGKAVDIHRLIAKLLFSDFQVNTLICHKNECTSRACINPEHLYKGTSYTNVRDMMKKGTLHTNTFKDREYEKITHCKRGHEYTKENTRISNGKRSCKTCDKIRRTASSTSQ